MVASAGGEEVALGGACVGWSASGSASVESVGLAVAWSVGVDGAEVGGGGRSVNTPVPLPLSSTEEGVMCRRAEARVRGLTRGV